MSLSCESVMQPIELAVVQGRQFSATITNCIFRENCAVEDDQGEKTQKRLPSPVAVPL